MGFLMKKDNKEKTKVKKPLTEAQVERRGALKQALKDLIAPTAVVAVVAIVLFIAVKFANKPEVYKEVRPFGYEPIPGYEEKPIVLESDKLILSLDPATTDFTVTQKSTGKSWYSNAENAENDPLALESEKKMLKSNVIISYAQVNGLETVLDCSGNVAKGLYEIKLENDTIKLFYSFGNIQREYVIPPVILEEDLTKWKGNLEKEDAQYVSEYYKKYDINKLSAKDNKDELLANYPSMADHIIYVLRTNVRENVKRELEKRFEKAGYTYEDFLNDKLLDESVSSDSSAVFNVEMDLRLEGSDLVVEVPFSGIDYKEQYPVYTVLPLPYFGAAYSDAEGFMFVPEGGGAIINYNNGKASQSDYYANVYGWDMCLSREYVIHNTRAYFNVFGQGRDGSSYICIMEEGASYASVRSAISGRINNYNYVDAKYSVCPGEKYDIDELSNAAVYQYLEKLPDESIVQRYRFIDSDDYVDMAKEYGRYLEEKYPGYMTLNASDETPVAIEIVGAIDKVRQVLGIPVSRPLKLTSYKDASKIVEELANAGIGDLSVKYSAWCNDGVRQNLLNNVHTISELGRGSDLKKLTAKAKELGVDLYLDGVTQYEYDSNIFDGFFSFRDAARFLNKERAELYQYSMVTYAAREGAKSYYLLRADLAEKMAKNLIKATDKYGAEVSFSDIGMDVSSDFRRGKTYSREYNKNVDINLLRSADDSGKKVMINMGNDYAIPYVDFVTNMELKGSEYTLLDKMVPFYQIAIHGLVNYSGQPINICGNEEQEILTSAEYGASLYYTLMSESSFAIQKTLYPEYYGSEYAAWKDRLIETCKRYNTELGSTFGQRMTGHRTMGDVTCTEYEDGSKVYVNYSFTDSYKTPEGTVVPARDYTLVK